MIWVIWLVIVLVLVPARQMRRRQGEEEGESVHDVLLQVEVAATHFEYAVKSDGVLRWLVGDKEESRLEAHCRWV